MGKFPAFQYYTGDWMKDPNLSMCSPATRGIWIDLICAMHELGRCGQVIGTVDQLCRLGRCTSAEMSAAIAELRETRTATVSERDGRFTVENRRMRREHSERENARTRKQKQRGTGDVTNGHTNVTNAQMIENNRGSPQSRQSHEDVTPSSSVSSSLSHSHSDSPKSNQSVSSDALKLPDGLQDAPVMIAYWRQFKPEDLPAIGAQERAIANVTDLKRWQETLDYWQDNGYRPESLGKMVDRYLEQVNGKSGKSKTQAAINKGGTGKVVL